jgi:HK97 gp10 family phage protein
MDISIKISGLDKLAKAWGSLSSELKQEAYDAFTKAGYIVEGNAKKHTPIDTGLLMRSINTSSRISMKGEPHVVISPHTNYATYVHQGTRKMKARPYMSEGYDDSKAKIETIMRKMLTNIVRKMAK